MIVNLIDYKGKYHFWQDKVNPNNAPSPMDTDVIIGEIDLSTLTDEQVFEHVDNCVYYGITPYFGIDETTHKRIEEAYNKINDMDANENICISCEG